MKKLIIACAAVLVLGLGLTTVGHVLGGQFYSVYYNGALHPFSDAAQNFSDKFVNISDHLVTADDDDDSDFDTDWVQDYLETRRNAIEGYSLPKQSLDHITSIDLTLKGGDLRYCMYPARARTLRWTAITALRPALLPKTANGQQTSGRTAALSPSLSRGTAHRSVR